MFQYNITITYMIEMEIIYNIIQTILGLLWFL